MVNRVGDNPPPNVALNDALRRAPKRVANLTAPIQGAPPRGQVAPDVNVTFKGPFMQIEFLTVFYLPADENRTYLFILNTGAGTMYADFTNGPGPNTRGVQIASPLGFYEPIRVPTTGVTISGTGVVLTSSKPGA